MLDWIKKLTCSHSWHYVTFAERTQARSDWDYQSKYNIHEDIADSYLRCYKWTYVVYQLCTKCQKKIEVGEFFGRSDSEDKAKEMVDQLNNILK